MRSRAPCVIGFPDGRARQVLSRAGFQVESLSVTGPSGEDWRVVRQRPAGDGGVSLVLAARKPGGTGPALLDGARHPDPGGSA